MKRDYLMGIFEKILMAFSIWCEPSRFNPMAKVAGSNHFKASSYLIYSLTTRKYFYSNETIITCCARRIEPHIGPSSFSNGALQGS